ncbi:50S ribosomal protein L13 [Candidatus Daviesbacteria bacterium]|nr:50S ribosomal protein L13 [Candidatus Daviesbacteria bacterium]
MKTTTMKNVKLKDITRQWHLIDAKNQVLGRLSTKVATHLMGKNKSYYTPYLDTGDYVVVVNARDVILTGRKEEKKKYWRHSGYPGGIFVKTASELRNQKPELLVKKAIKGMLPKTTLGKKMAKKLYVFSDEDYPFKEK